MTMPCQGPLIAFAVAIDSLITILDSLRLAFKFCIGISLCCMLGGAICACNYINDFFLQEGGLYET